MREDVSWAFLVMDARVMHLHRHQRPLGSWEKLVGRPQLSAVAAVARLNLTVSLRLGCLEPFDSTHLQFLWRFGFDREQALGWMQSTL